VSCRRPRYSKAPDVRIRPIDEMGVCLVYTPKSPKLYTLNTSAWLAMELCDGRTWASLERRYYDAIEPLKSREASAAELRHLMDDLVGKGIIEVAT
jgi:hypothetical protein